MKPKSSLIVATVALATPISAITGTPPEDQAAQAQDPIEPARPIGFERRDIEEMDRRIEERRERWRAEEALEAKAAQERKTAGERSGPS